MSFNNKYLALYRQYRPLIFDDVYGQEHIIESLKNIIRENKLTHAYLFCGPHGNGKTSTAKIFANAINCEHRIDENPCFECIKNINNNLDIIEIDAASNTGIDDIRELKEKIKLLPNHSKYKIYIIDEVHMLSKSAFNALLKTIEEPPRHVIFILATTDPQKIPLTILSRVQRFNFKKIDKEILFRQISLIFEKEGINAESDAIKLLVDLGNGSFRDTLSIADQVSIYCANKIINKKAIEELYGIIDMQNILFLINAIIKHNHAELIKKYNYLVENGASVEKMILQIFKLLKDYFVFKKTSDLSLLEFSSKDEIENLEIDNDLLFLYFELLNKAISESQNSDIPKQIIELYLLKMSSLHSKNKAEINSDPKHINIENKEINNLEKQRNTPLSNQDLNFDIKNNKENDLNTNIKKFNSIFDLSTISNSHLNEAIIAQSSTSINDIDNLGENKENKDENILNNSNKIKTVYEDNDDDSLAKIVLKEHKEKEATNTIINELLNPTYEEKTYNNNEYTILKAQLDQEEINKLAFIYQYIKMNLFGWGNNKIQTNLDIMYYNMLKNKLGTKFEYLYDLFYGFKFFLSTDDVVILKSEDINKVHHLNLKRDREDFIEASFSIFGRYINVIAIHQKQLDIAIENCKLNWKDTKHEEIKMISLLNLDKYKNKVPETIEYARKLFGDIVKEPKK